MKHLVHGPGLILIALVAVLGLSACGKAAPAPPAATPASTAASIAGDFVGKAGQVDAIGLSTNGQRLIAYACDGTATRAATFAVWFKGAVSHNAASLTAANGSRLVVTWTAQEATGTVTLNSGQSFSFTAPAVNFLQGAGLFRDEETFAGVRYLAGWIITNQKPATSSAASVAVLTGWFVPASPGMIGPGCCDRSRLEGGIIDEQTGALVALPALTQQLIAARRMLVPNLGTFVMALGHQTQFCRIWSSSGWSCMS